MSGIPELHAALSAKYRRDYGLEYAADSELTVTSGATEAIFAAIQGICDPGDEVVLFEPYYDSYKASVRMAGAVPRFVTLRLPTGASTPRARARPSARARARSSSTRPTIRRARSSRAAELDLLAALCREHDALCLSDEVYEHLVYEGEHVPMASRPGMRERTITISSLGKTFSLTGWKIGWAAAPPHLTAAVRAAHQFITFATATPAAARRRGGARGRTGILRGASRRVPVAQRTSCSGELARIGFDVYPPAGTYFVCAGFREFGFEDDVAFCRHLHREDRRRGDPAERLLRPPGAGPARTSASRSARGRRP